VVFDFLSLPPLFSAVKYERVIIIWRTGGAKRTPKGGSSNPIVFHDYESYIAKFREQAKTTDDTYTPPDVYEAVVKYVGTIYDLTDKVILRPFYPGGDYRNAEYPEDGVVIDNPPFSNCHPKKGGLFGKKEKEKAKEIAKEKAKERINIELSPREKRIIERLDSTE
jgi:hypothetical protein